MTKIKRFIDLSRRLGLGFALKKTKRALLLAVLSKFRRLIWDLKTRGVSNADLFRAHAQLVDQIWGAAEDLVVGKISQELLEELEAEFCSDSSFVDCEARLAPTTHPVLAITRYDNDVLEQISNGIIPGNMHEYDCSNRVIQSLHDQLRQIFDRHVGSPFVFVNTRIWKTKAGAKRFNSNAWHKDGFMPGHLKIMLYLTPLNKHYGIFSWRDSNGREHHLDDRPAGTTICFKNSEIEHSGVPGSTYDRICIEVTLMRSLIDGEQRWPGHFWGTHFKTPRQLQSATVVDRSHTAVEPRSYQLPDFFGKKKVNIGSGVRNWPEWICLDELEAPGVTKVTFSETSEFPIREKTVSLFYSSHFFEHISDEVVSCVLNEIKKCALPGAFFVLKIPDYTWFLDQYRSGVEESMKNKGLEDCLWSWSTKGVEDTFENRLLCMLCGYWNNDYGDHFSGKINTRNRNAFHGPPKLTGDQAKEVLKSDDPHKIVSELVAYSKNDLELKSFNHRNAWSKEEMEALLSKFDMEVIHTDGNVICDQFREIIPDIGQMHSWSSYYLCRLPV